MPAAAIGEHDEALAIARSKLLARLPYNGAQPFQANEHLSMTIQHAIVAFPTFDSSADIESVRRDFDPQATLLPAHVTLVFPFIAAHDTAFLREHIVAAIAVMSPFDIAVAAPSVEDGGYLFLRLTQGRERIVELHDRLYTGALRSHLLPEHPYEAHITVGRLDSSEALTTAAAAAKARLVSPLRGRIDAVSLFRLADGFGTVACTLPFSEPPDEHAVGDAGARP